MTTNLDLQIFTGGSVFTNGYLLTFEDGKRVAIDAPEGMTAWLQNRELTVDALLLTHVHYDHILDVNKMKAAFGCPVYSHSQPNEDLTLQTVIESATGRDANIPDFASDELLAEQSDMEPIPGKRFKILHVPGHSPDSLCFMPEGTDILFGGDVLFSGGIGRSDFALGDGELLVQGIREKVLTLLNETVVYPGHGPSTTVGSERGTNPFLQ